MIALEDIRFVTHENAFSYEKHGVWYINMKGFYRGNCVEKQGRITKYYKNRKCLDKERQKLKDMLQHDVMEELGMMLWANVG